MTVKRYTLIEFDNNECWVVHKPGCPLVKGDMEVGGKKQLVKIDLGWDDDHLLEEIDPEENLSSIEDIDFCACTETEPPPPPAPQPKPVHAAAEASRKAAAERLKREVEEIIDKLVISRGVDDIGEGDQWADERRESCTDDYVYDLAVEARKLRVKGEPWWRVGYELGLPGAGASSKQGRKGGAYARRLWRAAWGKTYVDDGTVVHRESKLTREARAMENLGKPYFSESEDAVTIIEKVRGQMLHWVTRLEGTYGLITSAQEAYVHDDPKYIRVKEGPKGTYLEFYEQLDPSMLMADPRKSITKSGPLRAVYIDRITRVGV